MVQIVANNRNGLDVDKYDYLQRDSMYCNTKISVDIKRIFSFVKVPPPIQAPCSLAAPYTHMPHAAGQIPFPLFTSLHSSYAVTLHDWAQACSSPIPQLQIR